MNGPKLARLVRLSIGFALWGCGSSEASHVDSAGAGGDSGGGAANGGVSSTSGSPAAGRSNTAVGGTTAGSETPGSSVSWSGAPSIDWGTEPTWPSLTLAAFREQYATARCRQLAPCCSTTAFNATKCEAVAYLELLTDTGNDETDFSAPTAASCLDQLARAGCAGDDFPSCHDVFRPHVARGMPCRAISDACEPSPAGEVRCIDEVCTLLWRRAEGQSCIGDTDVTPGWFGGSYLFRAEYSLDAAVCYESDNLNCDQWLCRRVPGKRCASDYCSPSETCESQSLTCQLRPSLGDACPNSNCYQSVCNNNTLTCGPLFANGTQCFSPLVCASGYCQRDQTCGPPSLEFCRLGI